MTVQVLGPPTSEQEQILGYNSNIGGAANKSVSFVVPANIPWAVVGTYLVAQATVGDMPTLVSDITALSEVTSVNGDQFFGQTEDTIPAGQEFSLYTTATCASVIGGGVSFTANEIKRQVVKPNVNQNWALFVLRLPTQPDAAALTALDVAITGITGVTAAFNLVDGYTPIRQVGNADLRIDAALRLETIEA